MNYEFKKIPRIEVAIITVKKFDRGLTMVPGIAWSADVEVILFKDEFSLTSNLSDLGDCFLVDKLQDIGESSIATKLRRSIPKHTDWEIDKVFYAVPLEMVKGGKYKMIHRGKSIEQPLFKCVSTLLYDSQIGTINCLESCLYQIDYLMGGCDLGLYKCSEGLNNHVPTNTEASGQQPEN